MCLLIFHLVLSGITFNGVDINMAQKILDWNLEEVPEWYVARLSIAFSIHVDLSRRGRCVFPVRSGSDESRSWSTGQGDSSTTEKAAAAQQQYRNLHLISFWEIAIANLALWDVHRSLERWTILRAEATVL
jgi:hypothetical protein